MALIQNGFRSKAECIIYRGAGQQQSFRGMWGRNTMRNISVGEGITDECCAIPDGNQHPASWLIATRSGGIAARNKLLGSSPISFATLAGGRNAVAALTGSGNITNAQLELIVFAVAAITASGNITASITGKLEAAASLAGQGSVTAALGALASAIAALTGSGAVANTSSLIAKGSLSADIVVTGTGLNTSNVAFYVWNALAASFNNPGTFGETLNSLLGEDHAAYLADIILKRPTAKVESVGNGSEAVSLRSLYGMIAQAVHNTQVSGTTLSVTESDDATVLGTRTVTLDPAAQPITGLNSD